MLSISTAMPTSSLALFFSWLLIYIPAVNGQTVRTSPPTIMNEQDTNGNSIRKHGHTEKKPLIQNVRNNKKTRVYREQIPLNRNWKFTPDFQQHYIESKANNHWSDVELPHTNHELPLTYFDEKSYQFVSTYKRIISMNELDKERINIMNFEGVMTAAKVYLNGQLLSEHKGGYTGFEVVLNPELNYDDKDEVTVVVDSTERPDIPPFGAQLDYLTYGGIYREVQIVHVNPVYISKIFAKPSQCLTDNVKLNVDVELHNTKGLTGNETMTVNLIAGSGNYSSTNTQATWSGQLTGQKRQRITVQFENLDIILWSLEHPAMYSVEVKTSMDKDNRRIGFREAKFTTEGFFLNGKPLKIRGLNRHQSFPYMGYAMPSSIQRQDADILKELGINLVRTSHYPQSRHFLDRCDEVGLLVIEEIPGWQHIGDLAWQDLEVKNVEDMIVRDRNHPSIVLWGVRVNESPDNHDLYTRTNAVAKKLDPTRQTTGIRALQGSELLEDVYSMNDFSLDGVKQIKLGQRIALKGQQDNTHMEYKVPYLVTEHNGHMYPTKKNDCEERQQEHALRHLLVLDAANADKEVSGSIGWCAFDYNTHKDFGSGDRICHHGVMDIFRLPKFASAAYRSQKSPEQEPVLHPMTLWTRGERAEGMEVSPMLVATNCDKVELFIDGKLYGRYFPSRAHFKGLDYPPVIIPDIRGEWGMNWQEGEFVGYYQNTEVIRKSYAANPLFSQLHVQADNDHLDSQGESWDATRIVISALDQTGNPLMYHNTIVNIEVPDMLELIGPKQITLIGGTGAFWVKTRHLSGEAVITITTTEGVETQITLVIK